MVSELANVGEVIALSSFEYYAACSCQAQHGQANACSLKRHDFFDLMQLVNHSAAFLITKMMY